MLNMPDLLLSFVLKRRNCLKIFQEQYKDVQLGYLVRVILIYEWPNMEASHAQCFSYKRLHATITMLELMPG